MYLNGCILVESDHLPLTQVIITLFFIIFTAKTIKVSMQRYQL